jgi:hypothetical protein
MRAALCSICGRGGYLREEGGVLREETMRKHLLSIALQYKRPIMCIQSCAPVSINVCALRHMVSTIKHRHTQSP